MKRIILLFIAIIACLVTTVAQVDTTDVVQQAVTETGIEYTDTPDSGNTIKKDSNNSDFSFPGFQFDSATTISIIAIVCVFGLPVLIVFIAFFFKHKNKKAKYKLAEQALAAGQPIPTEFFKDQNKNNTLQKGITNVFTGIGLFIFLWAITGEFSIGCVGLLIMFTGFGQVVIYYTQNNKKGDKEVGQNNDNNSNSIEE